ncbi:hypothetical protein F4777DRAFT_322790 [Nemania sp. FL0916]|nr:hypothetical protein F4777DRAFT_322790 [Nemania sp. FL0916]
MSTNYVTERPAGREHIPLYPKGFVAVRILQLVLGIICLGLTAYAVAVLPISGAGLMLFTAIITLISSVYILVAHFGPPAAYNYWAILGLDIFHAVFWLISFALLASQAAIVLSYNDYYFGSNAVTIFGSVIAAAAGLGGVQWVAYVVALVLHSIAFHRHRAAGLHAMPGHSASGPVNGTQIVADTSPAEKFEMQPQQHQAQGYYSPQQPQGATYQPQSHPQAQELQQPQVVHQQQQQTY